VKSIQVEVKTVYGKDKIYPVNEAAQILALKAFMPARKKFSADFDSTVGGIPCGIKVDEVEPYEPAYRGGHPDSWEPESGGQIWFTVLDRAGYPAPWLQAKLTNDDTARIEGEILKSLKEFT